MFLALWHYLRGYVIIKISGFSTERFMNLAALRGIYLWNIEPSGNSLLMCVGVGDFKKLKDCAVRSKCRVKIMEKKGFPFTLWQYKRRKFYSAGILVFVIAVYVMSSFVWQVSVEGNDRVSAEDIIAYCKEEGLYEGQLKFKLDNKALTQKMIADFSDISWVAITTQGTAVSISIVETLPKVTIETGDTPTSIISDKACIIDSISVSKGTPLVTSGDVVDVGDVLVSGELIIKDGETEMGKTYTRSKAVIRGKSVIVKENILPVIYTEREYTGHEKTDRSIVIGNYTINLISPNLEGLWEKTGTEEQVFKAGSTTIPFKIVTETYFEYNDIEKERSEEEGHALLEEAIREQRQELEFDDVEILEEKTEFYINNNEIRSKTIFTVIEYIGVEEAIVITEDKGGMEVNE